MAFMTSRSEPMTSRVKSRVKKRKHQEGGTQVARLRAENARLRAELRSLKRAKRPSLSQTSDEPAFPAPDADGYYPAEQTLDVILARQIIRRRRATGWT